MSQKRKVRKRLQLHMRKKLFLLFGILLLVLLGLIARLMYIVYTNGDKYEKKVLSMLDYDSRTIPYQRGNIEDCNGTILATSVPVYNIILDCSVMGADEEIIEATLNALFDSFPELDQDEIREYVSNHPDSKYKKLLKKVSYADTEKMRQYTEGTDKDGKRLYPDVKGIWYEKEYIRSYPYNTLAGSVIGFTSSGNVGTTGLENYYDDILNGVNGREYGYLNSESDFETTVVDATDGYNLTCSIDANIQSIVEEKIKDFNDAYTNNARDGDGSLATSVVIMNPNTGQILAMADYPTFDLNNPRDLSGFYSDEEIENMTDDEQYNALNGLWQNYALTTTYEPGSVQKPFTVACGLETGTLSKDMTFLCDGYEVVSGQRIRCVNRNGHGMETVEGALMDSCNDSLMQMSYLIGIDNFLNFQTVFGFGKKTGIDLPGEANTSTLVYTKDNMTKIDLATNSFGQNYNCTMIQMASAFSSLINGGTYYKPHIVDKITDSNGNTIENIEPTIVKKTVSEGTSATLREFLYNVVSNGTGKTAKVDGYSMGGKTGTAQKYDLTTHLRKTGSYLVSFMGFAPADDPEILIYCIIDEPNVTDQAHSSYAQNVVREILKEVLPYMGIYPDEETTGVNESLTISGTDFPERYSSDASTDTVVAPADEKTDSVVESEDSVPVTDNAAAQTDSTTTDSTTTDSTTSDGERSDGDTNQ